MCSLFRAPPSPTCQCWLGGHRGGGLGYHWHPGIAAEWEVPQTWEGQPALAGNHGPAKAPQLRGPLVVGLGGAFLNQAFREVPSLMPGKPRSPRKSGWRKLLLASRPGDTPLDRANKYAPESAKAELRQLLRGARRMLQEDRDPGGGIQGVRTSWCERLKKLKGSLTRDLNLVTRTDRLAASGFFTASISDGSPSGGADLGGLRPVAVPAVRALRSRFRHSMSVWSVWRLQGILQRLTECV